MQTYWKTKRENIPIKKPMKAMNARLSSVVAQLETLLTQWQPVCLSTATGDTLSGVAGPYQCDFTMMAYCLRMFVVFAYWESSSKWYALYQCKWVNFAPIFFDSNCFELLMVLGILLPKLFWPTARKNIYM